MINTLISIGPITLLLALLEVPVCYFVLYRAAPQPKRALPLLRYLLICLGVGIVVFGIGTMGGIAVACMPADAGNLCGLAGVFGAGPLLAGLAMAACAWLLAVNARRPV